MLNEKEFNKILSEMANLQCFNYSVRKPLVRTYVPLIEVFNVLYKYTDGSFLFKIEVK